MNFDAIIIGGGIVGLSSAMNLLESRPGLKLVLIEKEDQIAKHQTGNNSGVIHSGLYYKPGSLKARHCQEGYEKLIRFCQEEEIAHDICGKIVVATSEEELPNLDELHRRGTANGLDGVRYLERSQISEIEPHCTGVRGLFVPQTGIVDYKEVARKYAQRILKLGGEILLNTKVEKILKTSSGQMEVVTGERTLRAKTLVSCAGLHADRVAMLTDDELDMRITPFRGEYFELSATASHLVRNLIYPVPDPSFPFLGVHFTRMIGGGVECGPNAVFAFAREGYRKTDINVRDTLEALCWPGFRKIACKYWKTGLGEFHRSFSKDAFVKALQKLIPEITDEDLKPGGAGVRAQACSREGALLDDFKIVESERVIHVCNSPSPAATASISIGKSIGEMALKKVDGY